MTASDTTHSSSTTEPAVVVSTWRRGGYWAIWPLGALFLIELAATIVVPPGELQLISVMLAAAVLLAGILPALLRPAVATNLFGCFAVVLASIFWRAPSTLGTVPSFAELAATLSINENQLAVANVALLAPLTLHLAARFPQRAAFPAQILAGYYLAIAGLATAAFVLPLPDRQTALAALAFTMYIGFIVAGCQFLRTIQIVQPTNPRAAQQARLLLVSLIFAEAPLLLLPVSGLINLYIPTQIVLGAQIVLPIGIAYTIMRHDLFGIDAVLRRALDYAGVSFVLLAIYFGATTLLTQIGREVGGTWSIVATIMSLVAAPLAFSPLHRVTQRLIDRTFYPERLVFRRAISAARSALSRVVQRKAVITLLEEELPQQLEATWASLVLRPSFDQPAAATQPGVWQTLLLVGGEPLGSYWLGPRRSGLEYDADEQEQLLSLAQQAALVLAYAQTFDRLVQLNDELEERVATRTKHVLAQQRELAAFEERQRLARDLHDSVKQTLFSLGLGLRAARGRVRNNPDSAVVLLEQQEQAAIQAQTEMGDLLAQLRARSTDENDFVAILQQHGAWLKQQHGFELILETPSAILLSEPLLHELTNIVKEALHNVLRHSGANQARLTLAFGGDQLTLSVADQGLGFDPSVPHAGQGLRGMEERAAAVGGTLTIQTALGKGTIVWVKIQQKQVPSHPHPSTL